MIHRAKQSRSSQKWISWNCDSALNAKQIGICIMRKKDTPGRVRELKITIRFCLVARTEWINRFFNSPRKSLNYLNWWETFHLLCALVAYKYLLPGFQSGKGLRYFPSRGTARSEEIDTLIFNFKSLGKIFIAAAIAQPMTRIVDYCDYYSIRNYCYVCDLTSIRELISHIN